MSAGEKEDSKIDSAITHEMSNFTKCQSPEVAKNNVP